jgi:hypothetical protein
MKAYVSCKQALLHNLNPHDMFAANWKGYSPFYPPWLEPPQHNLDDATLQRYQELGEKWSQVWMNRKNDALSLYNHVTCNGAVFVTSDGHFLKRRAALRQLTLRYFKLDVQADNTLGPCERIVSFTMTTEILSPTNAVRYICQQTDVQLESYQPNKL